MFLLPEFLFSIEHTFPTKEYVCQKTKDIKMKTATAQQEEVTHVAGNIMNMNHDPDKGDAFTGKREHLFGKFLYGFLFVVVVPLFFLIFSVTADIPFSMGRYMLMGGVTALGGIFIMAAGMLTLMKKGKGLPMNAYPPEQFVGDGIYGVLPHPIYFGFVMLVLGVSLYAGSSVGTFLTTPLASAAVIALAVGHENIMLRKRFGQLPAPALGIQKLFLPVLTLLRITATWKFILHRTEILANSWTSYRLGPVRVMNHVWFSGLAGATGAFLVVLVTGREYIGIVSLLMLSAVIGAALLGQMFIDKSKRLNRPFGYFGGLLGVIIAGLVLSFFTEGVFLVLTAFCFAAPWVQAIGRLRCVVQGCCHGAPSNDQNGIIVTNRHSRVCAMTGMEGIPIYPTQLYSIIGNIMLGILLSLLWKYGASMTLIAGLYLALAGVIRFIEQGHRGEHITVIVAGLHIQQWVAVLMYLTGMVIMMFRSAPVPSVNYSSLPRAAAAALVFFIIVGFAMSVDFPESSIPFSRLSG
jgi:protein-S-isoprenylcysteine O-methyltransferase Ste14